MESLDRLSEYFIKERAVFIIKIDGQRKPEGAEEHAGYYTVMVSGGRVPMGDSIRYDGPELSACISICVEKYRSLGASGD